MIQSRTRKVCVSESSRIFTYSFVILGAASTEYVADKFSFNSPGYHDGQNVIDQKVIEEAEKQDVQQKDAKPEDDKKSEANALVTSGALLAAAAVVAVFL